MEFILFSENLCIDMSLCVYNHILIFPFLSQNILFTDIHRYENNNHKEVFPMKNMVGNNSFSISCRT